jgi:hypothetical protein
MSDDYPDVLRYLLADSTVGHKELQRAKVARAVKAPRFAWERDEKEEGVVGYYLKQPPLSCAIWGVVPHAPDDAQRWGWAIHITGKLGDQAVVATERAIVGADLAALAATPTEAHQRLTAALERWRTLVNQPLPQLDGAEDVPPVVRQLTIDQSVGHKELCRAKVACAVKTPEKP